MFHYQTSQFVIDSEMSLGDIPWFSRDGAPNGAPVLRLLRKTISREEPGKEHCLSRNKAGNVRCYDVGTGVLIYSVEGLRLHIDRTASEVLVDLRDSDIPGLSGLLLSFLGTIGSLLREEIPLHASAVELPGGGVCGLIARSGTGKSTTLWAMIKAGAKLVSDDVLPLRIHRGEVIAAPSASPIARLWKQTLAAYQTDWSRYQETDREKVAYPFAREQCLSVPRPVDALFLLSPAFPPTRMEEICAVRYPSAAVIPTLLKHTHHYWNLHSKLRLDMVRKYAMVADTIPLYSLVYEKDFGKLPLLLAKITEMTQSARRDRQRLLGM